MAHVTNVWLALVLIALPPARVAAQGLQGKWSMSFSGGGELPRGGTAIQNGSGVLLGLPAGMQKTSFPDLYSNGYRVTFGVGYDVGPDVEIVGDFNLGSARARHDKTVGSVDGLDLVGNLGKYKYTGAEGGVRVYFASAARIRPYVQAMAGYQRVTAILSTFSIPAVDTIISGVPFYAESVVGTFGGDAGLAVRAGARSAIGFEAGVRRAGALHPDGSGLADLGLSSPNTVGARWSLPLVGTVTVRF